MYHILGIMLANGDIMVKKKTPPEGIYSSVICWTDK